jgi:hypothetical protein
MNKIVKNYTKIHKQKKTIFMFFGSKKINASYFEYVALLPNGALFDRVVRLAGLAIEHPGKVLRVGGGAHDSKLARAVIRIQNAKHQTLVSVLGAPDLRKVNKEQLVLVEIKTGQQWLLAVSLDPLLIRLFKEIIYYFTLKCHFI